MRGWFRRLAIRRKLIAMILGTSAAVVALASAGQLVTGYFTTRSDAANDLSAQARIVLDNAMAAVLFDDRKIAGEMLATLRSNHNVRGACLYDGDRQLFAAHRQQEGAECPAEAPPEGVQFSGARMLVTLVERDREKDTVAATLQVRSDLAAVQQQLWEQAIIIGTVMIIALGVATLLSARLQAFVSEPIVDLSKTASAISARGDYSIRAVQRSEDEIGVLVDAFNRMLDRIQMREDELSRANDDLRREVAERRRAEQERAELLVREREANRLKDEFLATLSHELRTPLNAILGWTKLLRGNALPPSGVDRALEKVERNAQVQARLVEDLLEVSRITTGKLRLDIREMDLVALTGTALDSIRPTAEARGVRIERSFSDASLTTAGDPDRLQQVIWNLLSNAVKFTPAGGTVRIEVHRRGDVDELTVSDTGIGIDPAFLPNVFDTFRQADASSTRSHGGLGLGLSIVRHLVEVHGGSVSARSAGIGQGATFTVRLPVRTIVAREAAVAGGAAAGRAGLLGGYRIVVVDDDTDARELLQSVLSGAGAEVHVASSAEEAVAACQREHPDAVVSDIGMPGRDGYSLMRELRASANGLSPRVAVAVSAYAGTQDRQQALDAGFQRHLAKPIDPATLVQTLRDLLEGHAAPQQA